MAGACTAGASNCMHEYAWISDDITDDTYATLSTNISPMQRCCVSLRHSAYVHAIYLHGDMFP